MTSDGRSEVEDGWVRGGNIGSGRCGDIVHWDVAPCRWCLSNASSPFFDPFTRINGWTMMGLMDKFIAPRVWVG
jgi:hypothetical protein